MPESTQNTPSGVSQAMPNALIQVLSMQAFLSNLRQLRQTASARQRVISQPSELELTEPSNRTL